MRVRTTGTQPTDSHPVTPQTTRTHHRPLHERLTTRASAYANITLTSTFALCQDVTEGIAHSTCSDPRAAQTSNHSLVIGDFEVSNWRQNRVGPVSGPCGVPLSYIDGLLLAQSGQGQRMRRSVDDALATSVTRTRC